LVWSYLNENIFPEGKIFSAIKFHAADSLFITCRPMVIEISVEIITLLQLNSCHFSKLKEHDLADNFYNQTKYRLKMVNTIKLSLSWKETENFISPNLGIFSNATYRKKILAWNRIGWPTTHKQMDLFPCWTKFGLYFHFNDWFGTKSNSVWYQINRKSNYNPNLAFQQDPFLSVRLILTSC